MEARKQTNKKGWQAIGLGFLWMAFLGVVPAWAAPTNVLSAGDFEVFSAGPVSPMGQPGNPWTIASSSGSQMYGIDYYDIDGGGALGTSKAFTALVGATGGGSVTISQWVSLTGGVEYSFFANIASTTPASNADGGTVAARIALVSLDTYGFETIFSSTPEYATLSGSYSPMASGDYLLSIEISRQFQISSASPRVYLDNIQFSYNDVEVIPAPGALLLSGLGVMMVRWIRFGRREINL